MSASPELSLRNRYVSLDLLAHRVVRPEKLSTSLLRMSARVFSPRWSSLRSKAYSTLRIGYAVGLVVLSTTPAAAIVVQGSFQGTVQFISSSDVPGGLTPSLHGISTGNSVSGTFIYDTAVTDSNPSPTDGRYLFTSPPSRFSVQVGNFQFSHVHGTHSPSNSLLEMEVQIGKFNTTPGTFFNVIGFAPAANWPIPSVVGGVQFFTLHATDVQKPLFTTDALPVSINLTPADFSIPSPGQGGGTFTIQITSQGTTSQGGLYSFQVA